MEEDVFSDSDTDYAEVEKSPSLSKKASPKKRLLASPKVSRQMKKTKLNNALEIEVKHSPKKSPRTLKQLFRNNVSPKSVSKPLKLPDHVPLTLEKRSDPNHVPYYLLNFECILRGVIDETDDKELFDESEVKLINDFRNLSLNAKKLYVRLFQRKFAWISRKSISYDEIQDIDECLVKLCDEKLAESGATLNDLETILNILSAPSVRQLCKSMNVMPKGSQKKDGVEALLNHSKKKSFFTKANTLASTILKKARDLMDCDVFRISEQSRCIFMRVLSLYSLSNWWEERESEKGQQNSAPQLTTILLQNTGRLVFPIYNIIRSKKIFRSRDDLLHFESICALESEMAEQMNDKNWEGASLVVKKAMEKFDELVQDQEMMKHVKSLPDFLRKFTSGSVLAYILSKGVEVFERMKTYQEAVNILKKLTDQQVFLADYHGHWFERLVLDLDQHLKSPNDCLEAIRKGLDDPFVQEARLLSLCQRVSKLSSSKKTIVTFKEKQAFLDHKRWLTPQEPKVEVIQGKMLPKANMKGEKTIFVVEGKTEGENDLLCSVEEYVKEYYKREKGFTNGLHAEGSVVNTMATILFWDIIYDLDIEDVFRSPHQPAPLDFNSGEFYKSRKEAIDQRLTAISEWSREEISDFVTEKWNSCCQITACPANWELFTSLSHFLSLLKAFKGPQLSGICRRLMVNHRHTRSGFPDLTMWDNVNDRVAFVEVKGPNDRLSNKQILWLDYLCSLGLEAVVCHIEPLNGKRLKPNSPKKSPKKKKVRNSSGDDFQ